ncbi:MAG: STAS domain-containing protein, partial [Planctomycetales bacterium]|nr:STAS domain-containing protein [Planctomycetales bacterium]
TNPLPGNSQLVMGHAENEVIVRIVGRGTMHESACVRAFIEDCLDNDASVLLDLNACNYLDSTFLGCLIALHRLGKRHENIAFRVCADHATCQRLLSTSTLTRLLNIVPQCPSMSTDEVCVAAEVPEPDALGRHVMQCHRLLADLGGEHAEQFRAIANRLELELEHSRRT